MSWNSKVASNPIGRFLLLYLKQHVLFGIFFRPQHNYYGRIKRLAVLFSTFASFLLAASFSFTYRVKARVENYSDFDVFIFEFLFGKLCELVTMYYKFLFSKKCQDKLAAEAANARAVRLVLARENSCWNSSFWDQFEKCWFSPRCFGGVMTISLLIHASMYIVIAFAIPWAAFCSLPGIDSEYAKSDECKEQTPGDNVLRAFLLFLANTFFDIPFFLVGYVLRKMCCPSTLEVK
jgi:hypothetical protein